jgi:ssDNA-binding Zn-finger/Zn-ribbon topoisomerase 1
MTMATTKIKCPDCGRGNLRATRSLGGAKLMYCGVCHLIKWFNPFEIKEMLTALERMKKKDGVILAGPRNESQKLDAAYRAEEDEKLNSEDR